MVRRVLFPLIGTTSIGCAGYPCYSHSTLGFTLSPNKEEEQSSLKLVRTMKGFKRITYASNGDTAPYVAVSAGSVSILD